MKLFFTLVSFSFLQLTKAQLFLEYDKLYEEFCEFENKLLSYPIKDTVISNITEYLKDYELIWKADIPERNSVFGLVKCRFRDKAKTSHQVNSFIGLDQLLFYGDNYILIDIFDPPQGSVHDIKHYYKRKFVHYIDDLIQDTISIVYNAPIFSKGNSIDPKLKTKYPYAFNGLPNQFSDTNLVSTIDSTLNFSLQYCFESSVSSGPLPFEGYHTMNIYTGSEFQIKASELELSKLGIFSKGNSQLTGQKLGSFLYKIENDYFYQITDEYIGNTSRLYSKTYCLKVTNPQQVYKVNQLFNDRYYTKYGVFDRVEASFYPQALIPNLIEDKKIDSAEYYFLFEGKTNSYTHHPLKDKNSSFSTVYGNQNYISSFDLINDSQFKNGTFKSYNKGKYLFYYYFEEYIGNRSHGTSITYLFEKVYD